MAGRDEFLDSAHCLNALPGMERTLEHLKTARQLPRECFTEPAVHAWEIENLFRAAWRFVGLDSGPGTEGA